MRNVLQNLVFPSSEDAIITELFHSTSTFNSPFAIQGLNPLVESVGGESSDKLDVYNFHVSNQLTRISFYSYFNVFSIDRWKKYTCVDKVGIHLAGSGKCILTIYVRSMPDVVKVVCKRVIVLDGGYDSPEIDLAGINGLMFFDLDFLTPDSGEDSISGYSIESGFFWTNAAPEREIRLNMIVTTYKREKYIHAIIRSFKEGCLHDLPGTNSGARLMLIDNGGTLADHNIRGEKYISVVPNPNTGGAGGFSRGMIESLADAEATHFLLMDDDVEFKAESIIRAMHFIRFANNSDFCLGGAMLNGLKPWIMHEQGARIKKHGIYPNKYDCDLRNVDNLWRVCEEERTDYHGWWFLHKPRRVCVTVGLALPIFFRGDDIDFSFRLRAKGFIVVELNGVCVWHEPFVYKDNPAQFYYDVRNQMLLVMTRDPRRKTAVSTVRVVATVFSHFTHAMLCHRYRRAERICEAVRDFLKGPGYLAELDVEAFNHEMMSCPEEKIEPIHPDNFDAYRFGATIDKRPSFLTRLAGWVTLGGLLVPKFLRKSNKDDPVGEGTLYQMLPSLRAVDISKGFRAKKIIYMDRATMKGFVVEIQTWRGVRLWVSGIACIVRLAFALKTCLRAYNAELDVLSSPEAWRNRLDVKQK